MMDTNEIISESNQSVDAVLEQTTVNQNPLADLTLRAKVIFYLICIFLMTGFGIVLIKI